MSLSDRAVERRETGPLGGRGVRIGRPFNHTFLPSPPHPNHISHLPSSKYPRYDGDYKPLLDGVRTSIDALAATWSRADKDRCLAETEKSFEYSGKLLRVIVEPIKAA